MMKRILKNSRKIIKNIGIPIINALKKQCSLANKPLHLIIKVLKYFINLISKIIKKTISFILLLIFGLQYKIQRDLSRLAYEIKKDKSIKDQEKDLEIMISIREYYNSINVESYEILYQRLEYLSYKKNMLNGMISGVIASFVFFIIQYFLTNFPPILKDVFIKTDSMLIKIVLYSFSLIIFIFLIIIPTFLLIKFVLIYCFRVFFDYKESYFDIYERKIIEESIKNRLHKKEEI